MRPFDFRPPGPPCCIRFSGARVSVRGGLSHYQVLQNTFDTTSAEQPHACHVRDTVVPYCVHAEIPVRLGDASLGHVPA